jgi:hypothetical protein
MLDTTKENHGYSKWNGKGMVLLVYVVKPIIVLGMGKINLVVRV